MRGWLWGVVLVLVGCASHPESVRIVDGEGRVKAVLETTSSGGVHVWLLAPTPTTAPNAPVLPEGHAGAHLWVGERGGLLELYGPRGVTTLEGGQITLQGLDGAAETLSAP